jgi:hypothetical protein
VLYSCDYCLHTDAGTGAKTCHYDSTHDTQTDCLAHGSSDHHWCGLSHLTGMPTFEPTAEPTAAPWDPSDATCAKFNNGDYSASTYHIIDCTGSSQQCYGHHEVIDSSTVTSAVGVIIACDGDQNCKEMHVDYKVDLPVAVLCCSNQDCENMNFDAEFSSRPTAISVKCEGNQACKISDFDYSSADTTFSSSCSGTQACEDADHNPDRRRLAEPEAEAKVSCPPWSPTSSKLDDGYDTCSESDVEMQSDVPVELNSADALVDIKYGAVGTDENGRSISLDVLRTGADSFELAFTETDCARPAHLKEFALTFYLTEDASEICFEDSQFHSFEVDDSTEVDITAQPHSCNQRPGASHSFSMGREEWGSRDRRRGVSIGFRSYTSRVAFTLQGQAIVEFGSENVCEDEGEPDPDELAIQDTVLHRLRGFFA